MKSLQQAIDVQDPIPFPLESKSNGLHVKRIGEVASAS
jgi:hypothetical protein